MQGRIPLAANFADELNALIISYLSPGDLRLLMQQDTQNFCEQINISRHVYQRWSELPNDMLPGLVAMLQKIPNAVLEYDEKTQEPYKYLCEKNQTLMLNTLQNHFNKKLKNITPENIEFMRECIFHFAFQFPDLAGALLNGRIIYADQDMMLDLLIESGADVNAKNREYNLTTLDSAMLYCGPSYQIIDLVNHGARFSAGLPSGYHLLPINYSTLVFAAIHQDPDTLSFLVNHHPEEFQPALDTIRIMHSRSYFMAPFVFKSYQDDFKFSAEKVELAYKKLLLIRNEAELKLPDDITNQDKSMMLSHLREMISNAVTLQACFDIYEKQIKAKYINQHAHPNYDYVVSTFFNAPEYNHTKKIFIEMLRERTFHIVTSTAITIKFKVACRDVCQQLLAHPIFAEEHDKKGVDIQFKNKILERIAEINKSIPSNSGTNLTLLS